MNRIRLTLLVLLLTVTAVLRAETFTPEWDPKIKIDLVEAQKAIYLRAARTTAAQIGCEPKDGIGLLKISFENGCAVFDTREFKQAHPAGKVVVRLTNLPFREAHRLKEMFVAVTLSSTPGGLPAQLYFEGNQGEAKKHYWKAKNFVAGEEEQTVRFEQTLPGDLNVLQIRLDLPGAGIYRLRSGAYGESESAPTDAAKNWITNGGAELGFYNTGTYGKNNFALADDGKIYDGRGKQLSEMMDAKLDRDERHSGLYSFKLTGGPEQAGRFCFNSVPFEPGKPATFSVWLKAEKPGTRVNLMLFLGNGEAYGKSVSVGTDWKRYELAVPRWGEKAPGISIAGDPVNGGASIYKEVEPQIGLFTDGTLWVDDAAYHLGPAADVAAPGISIRGKLQPERSYAVAGETLNAALTLESPAAKTVEIRREAVDYFGRSIGTPAVESVELPAGKAVEKNFTLTPPKTFRGPLTWRFTVDGIPYHFYAGVIGPDASQAEWLGMNYDSRQNAETAIRLLKEFRFGSVRLWSEFRELPYHGFRDVPYFKKNGFYVMLCLGLRNAAPSFLVPLDFTGWQAELRREAEKVKGQVDCYEVLNESNIWSGRTPVAEPAKYEEMTPAANMRVIKAAAEALRKADPAVKIGGPASCHTDINWTANLLKLGAAPYLDIVTEHPYRELPELPDYEEDIHSLRALLDRYRNNFPLIASEAGERGISIFAHEEIPEFERERTAYNLRMMLIALANGYRQYHHFSLDLTSMGTGWAVTLTGNPENDTLSRPSPVLYALRNAADRLGKTVTPIGRVRLGSSYRCYLFDRGDRRVAALWKWNGKPSGIRLPNEAAFDAFDVMGNPLDPKALTLSGQPIWLESALPAKEFTGALEKIRLTDDAGFPETRLVVTGAREFGIELVNPAGTPVSGEVRILTPNIAKTEKAVFEAIPGEGKTVLRFVALNPIGPTDRPVEVMLSVPGKGERKLQFNLKSILVPRAEKPLTIDGDLSDWPAGSEFARLGAKNAVKTGKGDAGTLERMNAGLRLAWDDDFLYLAVETDKPECVANTISPSRLWSGDGLQLAFDPLRNATPEQGGYQDDDYEFSAGLFEGKPVVYMHCAAAARHDSVDKSLGVVPHVRSAIRTANGKTVYELAFPRLLVSPFRLQPDSAMRFNVIVNVNDGKERVGWLELTPGIGQQPKRPGLFTDLVLLK